MEHVLRVPLCDDYATLAQGYERARRISEHYVVYSNVLTELLEKVECQVFPANLEIHSMARVFPNTVTKEWFVTDRGSYAKLLERGLIKSSAKSKIECKQHVWRIFNEVYDEDGITEYRHCRLCQEIVSWKRPSVKP